MKPSIARNILVGLLLFLGISALRGGSLLIVSSSGRLIGGLPLSILKNSPFPDFLIPGIILFNVLGVLPCLTCYALVIRPVSRLAQFFNVFSDMYWGWSFSIYISFALIIWIQVETLFVQSAGWLQTFYMLYAIPIIIIALLPQVRANYKIHKTIK
jgi:hypothetical protein